MEKKEFEESKIKIREMNEEDIVCKSLGAGTLVPDDDDAEEVFGSIGFTIG